MPPSSRYRPAPHIQELGEGFFDAVTPAPFPRHQLRFRNQRHAETVGLDTLTDEEWAAHFARFEPLPGNLPRPLALRYHGHQFDVYNSQLGDGRGFLFAQLEDGANGEGGARRLLDLGTKGSGRTPWSRGGDGKLTLKGGVREVLATEMLEAMGVNTSKTFSLFETGESLMRGDEPSPTRSSVMVRLSHSHLRIGSFQRHAHAKDVPRLDKLVDYAIAHFFPELTTVTPRAEQVARFFFAVCGRNAALCASFMVNGFVHGVLNSDNLTVTGESFDYGPYRFLPRYDLGFTAAYFDQDGLYSYGHQPRAFLRNMTRLAECLRLVAPDAAFGPGLAHFEKVLQREAGRGTVAKLGVRGHGDDPEQLDAQLGFNVYAFLDDAHVDFEEFFFQMYGGPARPLVRARFGTGPYQGALWDKVQTLFELFEPLRTELPAYFAGAAPETLLIAEIERIWDAIAERDDWAPFEAKIAALRARGAASLVP
jgi:uncharacterized protein YdiU (UPF0061 family)